MLVLSFARRHHMYCFLQLRQQLTCLSIKHSINNFINFMWRTATKSFIRRTLFIPPCPCGHGSVWPFLVVATRWRHLTENCLQTPKMAALACEATGRTSSIHSPYDWNVDLKFGTSHTRTILNLTHAWKKLECCANTAIRGDSWRCGDSWRFVAFR